MSSTIILALQICPLDAEAGLELTRLICDIEPKMRDDIEFAIVLRKDTPAYYADTISDLARRKFEVVNIIWGKRNETGWPDGCNAIWQETMMRCSMLKKSGKSQATGVMTIEADTVPLREDWLAVSKAEWDGRPEGIEAIGHVHGGDHINGNAIFHINILRLHHELNGGGNGGWDYVHRDLLMNIGKDSNLFFQIYKMFDPSRKNIEKIRKNGIIPALFHGTKGMVGIQVVRQMLQEGRLTAYQPGKLDAASITKDFEPKEGFSILIRSYEKDFPWLIFCLRSILKFLSGYHEIIIVVPTGQGRILENLLVGQMDAGVLFPGQTIIEISPAHTNGYLDQQITKLRADEYCAMGYILHIDSDCVFDNPVRCEDYLQNNKPTILYRFWPEVGDAACWKECTQSALKLDPPFEGMAALPIVHHRDTYPRLRAYIQDVQGLAVEDYISTITRLSEFNLLATFCASFLSQFYNFTHADPATDGIPRLRQHWSWGGLTPEKEAELVELTKLDNSSGQDQDSDPI